MRERLIRALGRLASIKYQTAYILEGTKDEYVLPEDLVEDVASLSEQALRKSDRMQLSPSQVAALEELRGQIRIGGAALFQRVPRLSADELVCRSPAWAALREAAARVLLAFGHDIRALAADEIDQGRWISGGDRVKPSAEGGL